MKLIAENLCRSFGAQKVVDDFSYTFNTGGTYALLGGNGSGKSTLLKLFYSALSPSSGTLLHLNNDEVIKQDQLPYSISIAGPYLELIEELKAEEFLAFYQKFRTPIKGFSPSEVLEICELQKTKNKEIRNFSSGMKQRLRLGLALLSESQLILLDEPTSNFDPKAIEWYRELVHNFLENRTLIIGSNFQDKEMDFCSQQLKAELWD